MKKRLLSLLLAALMLTALLPGAAAAQPKDVLNTLTSKEQNALYQDLLLPISLARVECDFSRIDSKTISDDDLLLLLSEISLVSQAVLNRYGRSFDEIYNCHHSFAPADFTRMTQDMFGRTINYSAYSCSSAPNPYVYDNYFWQGRFYLVAPQKGCNLDGFRANDASLYPLGGNLYYTEYECYAYSGAGPWDEYFYDLEYNDGAVVKKNTNGTWTLVQYYTERHLPTWDQLQAYVEPSSWAKAEVTAAERAGLVPDLDKAPLWQDNTTRLQFCQLAVRLAETATGRTLPAPADPFGDTNHTDVRKAYAAGIVNGMSADTFAPDGTLTREQLATMLWRTIRYIQDETGSAAMAPSRALTGFADARSVSAWAVEGVATLNAYGVMKGTSATTLAPQSPCTVEQAVLLSYRTYQTL